MQPTNSAAVFRAAIQGWSAGDLEGVLKLFADDIVHTVHVGALDVPYMVSANGKAEVRQRLELIMATFVVDTFVIESLVEDLDEVRATIQGYHTHRKTGERLDVRLRFLARVRGRQIARLDEYIDTAYFEAFERFVRYLEQTAQDAAAKEE
jgi:ketosteroid isomerase-like protein